MQQSSQKPMIGSRPEARARTQPSRIGPGLMVFVLLVGAQSLLYSQGTKVSAMLLDDFTGQASKLGTQWQGFTDRVMGGISDIQAMVRAEGTVRYLSMRGQVSLKNNGGFIQVRLPLVGSSNEVFDAKRFTGIRLVTRGTGEDYYIFLRTSDTVMSWSFFKAKIGLLNGEWKEVLIPFSTFEQGDFIGPASLDVSKLQSIAVVAYKKEFSANIDVREIGFY